MSERTATARTASTAQQRATVPRTFRPVGRPLLQRTCACGSTPGPDGECAACRAGRLARQRTAAVGPAAPATVPPVVHDVLRSPGRPLDPAARAFMELRFGHDFSLVRVHTDAQSAASARAVDALAYTVGRDVVFGAGQYAPHSPAGRRLLAHELAHVAQQSGALQRAAAADDARSEATREALDEAEADRAAGAVAGGHAAPALGASALALRRQEAPAESEEQRRVSTADLLCDIPALCRLRAASPSLVSDERIRAVAARCRPGTLITLDPCLSPQFILQLPAPAGPLTPAPAGGGGGGAGSSGLNLGSLTTFRFNAGPVRFNVDLPSSATATLPVPLSGARTIEFSLNAAPTAFSFSAVLNGVPHVRIAARAGVDVSGGTASAGLTVTTTRTVCRAAEPETARTEITAAGARLQKAINDWQTGAAPAPAAGGAASAPPATLDRLQEIGSAIGALYQAVDRVKRPCEQRPVVTFGLGVQGPLGPGEEPGRTPPSTVGGTLTFHF